MGDIYYSKDPLDWKTIREKSFKSTKPEDKAA